eukprot:jgi/Mesen1/7461/ME000389S06797
MSTMREYTVEVGVPSLVEDTRCLAGNIIGEVHQEGPKEEPAHGDRRSERDKIEGEAPEHAREGRGGHRRRAEEEEVQREQEMRDADDQDEDQGGSMQREGELEEEKQPAGLVRMVHAGVEEVAAGEAKRVAVITGVARRAGIGRCLVHAFLEEGYNVLGSDIRPLEEDPDGFYDSCPASLVAEGAEGGAEGGVPSSLRTRSFHFVRADISNPKEVQGLIVDCLDHFGPKIHAVINNAGKTNPYMTDVVDPMAFFRDCMAVNLTGAFNVSHCARPYMPRGDSSIVHISSTRAHQSEPTSEGYASAKAGLLGLAHAQAITLAGHSRVNAVLPGWINTSSSGSAYLQPEDHSWHPVGRVGVPADVAEMCLFLCDERRAGFITGQEFVVDGGVSKKMVYPE